MRSAPERFTVDHLLPRADEILALEQRHDRIAVHWHDFYELAYVVAGEATHVVNGEPEQVAPGSVFMLTPADFHEFTSSGQEQLVCINVVIDAPVVERDLGDLAFGATSWIPATVHGCDHLAGDFRRLLAESAHGGLATAALREAALRCILIEVARQVGSPTTAPPAATETDAALRRALVYVDRHFREQLTLAEVARQAHWSPNYLSERFSEVVGTTFQTYLQNRRLRFARALLVSTGLGVSEVCFAAGFGNTSHFGRAYRRKYGRPPSAERSSPG